MEIVIPEKVSNETKKILRDLGATLHETSDDLCPRVGAGTDQSIALAKAISKPRPDVYYMPNQYENDANYLLTTKAPVQRFGRRQMAKYLTFLPVVVQGGPSLVSPPT